MFIGSIFVCFIIGLWIFWPCLMMYFGHAWCIYRYCLIVALFLGPLSCYFILWFRDILNARVIFLLCHLSTIVHPCSFVHLFSSSCCIQSVLPLQVSSLSSLWVLLYRRQWVCFFFFTMFNPYWLACKMVIRMVHTD